MVFTLGGTTPGAPRSRVTDDVGFFCRRGEIGSAVNVVQTRDPDFHRWRRAFNFVARASCAWLAGRDLLWSEAALRDLVESVPNPALAKELVLDARESRVRMNLSDPLPHWTARDLMQFADENDVDMGTLKRIAKLPPTVREPIDTGGVVLVTREMARRHRLRAQSLWLELPDEEGEEPWEPRHEAIARVAEKSSEVGAHWKNLAVRLVG
ncbi:MAG: hypothetical protein HYY06_12240 [Deltaproteobacteria bacterium]|nr:hypothetical protein [Deltaproteobacteria bacterium]